MADLGAGGCRTVQCNCDKYQAQLYRPALCARCFHPISDHSDDWLWLPAEAKYVSRRTGQTLFARIADADDGAAAAIRLRLLARQAEGGIPAAETAAPSWESSAGWSRWSTTQAPAAATLPASPSEAAAALATAAASSSEGVDADSDGEGVAMTPAVEPISPTAATAAATASSSLSSSSSSAAAPAVAAAASTASPASGSSTLDTSLIPATPTAVTAAALAQLGIDLTALSRRLGIEVGGTPPAPAPAVPAPAPPAPAVPALAPAASVVVAVPPAPVLALPPPPALPPPTDADGTTALAPSAEAAAASGSSEPVPEADEPGSIAADAVAAAAAMYVAPLSPVAAEAEALAAAAAAPALPPAPREPTAPAPSLLLHLGAIFDDPLQVNLSDPVFQGSGVLTFRVQQPYDEEHLVPRYLLVTPFTILGISPHPTKLGIGIVMWERSVLSLRSLVSQPLFRAVDASVRGSADSPLFDTLPFDTRNSRSSSATASTDGKTGKGVGGLLGSMRNLLARGSSGAALAPAPAPAPAAAADANKRYQMYGVGLLASFDPETDDTLPLLRMVRAGRRPVTREGWLVKRKKLGWRERAPLGPLAWKKRYFVLEGSEIRYFKQQVGPKAELKGIIPLTGWVEVLRTGPGIANLSPSLMPDTTTRPFTFVLRTGKSYHVFQAANALEADAWTEAIAVNAQYSGATSMQPQELILSSHAEAEHLAVAVQGRMQDLVESSLYTGDRSAPELMVELSSSMVMANAASAAVAQARAAREGRLSLSPLNMMAVAPLPLPASSTATASASSDPTSLNDAHAATAGSAGAGGGGAGDDGVSIAEAEALVLAMGGLSAELLAQLPPQLARQLATRHGRMDLLPAPPVAVAPVPVPNAGFAPPAAAAPAAAAAAPALPPPTYPVPAASLYFQYVDDAGSVQGPFSGEQMHAWLWAHYFTASTLCKSADPLPVVLLDGSPAAAQQRAELFLEPDGRPTLFLPLSLLWPDPRGAFRSGDWVTHYRTAAAFQRMADAVIEMGYAAPLVLSTVRIMQERGAPADLLLLLDLVQAGSAGSSDGGGGGSVLQDASSLSVAPLESGFIPPPPPLPAQVAAASFAGAGLPPPPPPPPL